jgi:hypothetical protein
MENSMFKVMVNYEWIDTVETDEEAFSKCLIDRLYPADPDLQVIHDGGKSLEHRYHEAEVSIREYLRLNPDDPYV